MHALCWREEHGAPSLLRSLRRPARDRPALPACARGHLLGRALLGTGDAERARTTLERAIALAPDPAPAHLALGRAYHALGEDARARNQFALVLHFDNLPQDLLTQVRIYDEAAREALEEGRRTTMFGYAADDNHAIDVTLDYRHRDYQDSSRDDRDLRWGLAASAAIHDSSLAGGVRGRVSYRGEGDYRNDVAGYIDWTRNLDIDSTFALGMSVERRRCPHGRLRARSRTAAIATAGWNHTFADGAGSFGFTAHAGRNYAPSRPDGDSDLYGATASIDWTFTPSLDAFAYAWWQHDVYNTDRVHFHPDALDESVILRREDNLYKGGLGLIWAFGEGWSLRPELLYIRDQSNSVAFNYSSTEVWLNVRKG